MGILGIRFRNQDLSTVTFMPTDGLMPLMVSVQPVAHDTGVVEERRVFPAISGHSMSLIALCALCKLFLLDTLGG